MTYDRFDNTGWGWTGSSSADRAGNTDVLGQTLEGEDDAPVQRAVSFVVQPLAYRGTTVFSPNTPQKVDQASKVTLVGGQYFGTLDVGSGSSYTVTALVDQTADDDPDGLTENKLRAASTSYPAAVTDLYLQLPAGAVGPDLQALLATIKKRSPSDSPYDLAQTTVNYLRSSAFTYSTDVTNLECGSRSIAECFAHFKTGYCQYYATTMAVLMRMEGIPARYVQGFLPGDRSEATSQELIRYSSSHAWVEVYFPGYGWITFDPTGGGVGRLTALPAGGAVGAPSRRLGHRERWARTRARIHSCRAGCPNPSASLRRAGSRPPAPRSSALPCCCSWAWRQSSSSSAGGTGWAAPRLRRCTAA